VHAERLVHKLIPRNEPQRRAVELVRQLIWWFYADLKAYRREPDRRRRTALRTRFDRIFRRRTGFATLDRLLQRLHANKAELLVVLDRPEVPLHTNHRGSVIRLRLGKPVDARMGARGAADAFLVAQDPGHEHGPWAAARLRVVTPQRRSRLGK
jgi:crotonobetainyl-CoA:carnitine CoA-transferase CaiB-like acyl-CoA transferase